MPDYIQALVFPPVNGAVRGVKGVPHLPCKAATVVVVVVG